VRVLSHPDGRVLSKLVREHATAPCWACRNPVEMDPADRRCATCATPMFGFGKGPGRACCSYRCAGELKDREAGR
jgi:hypothetical protein